MKRARHLSPISHVINHQNCCVVPHYTMIIIQDELSRSRFIWLKYLQFAWWSVNLDILHDSDQGLRCKPNHTHMGCSTNYRFLKFIPRLISKTTTFSKHGVFEVLVMVTLSFYPIYFTIYLIYKLFNFFKTNAVF